MPINDRRETFGWAMYDWANSGFSATVLTVISGPYLTALARADVGENGVIFDVGPFPGGADSRSSRFGGCGHDLPRPCCLPADRFSQPVSRILAAFRALRRLPQTLRYLAAYMLFNDGIQTFIAMTSLFLSQELFVARGLCLGNLLSTEAARLKRDSRLLSCHRPFLCRFRFGIAFGDYPVRKPTG